MIQFLRSVVITTPSSLLQIVPPLHGTSLFSTLPFCSLCFFGLHCRAGSCVSYQSLLCAHAAFIPVAKQSAIQVSSALLSPNSGEVRILTTFYAIDTSSAVHFRSSSYNIHDYLSIAFSLIAHYHSSLLQQHRVV
jgi:hypothetical protein